VERRLPKARARNETLRATRHCGKAFWKRWTGYHAGSRIEANLHARNPSANAPWRET
jgi:hypothetical protein